MAAFDLDETAVVNGVISPENQSAIQRMDKLGIICVPASGRIFQQMLGFQRQLKLKGPMVTCNGAVVRMGREILRECYLPYDTAERLLKYAFDNGLTALSYLQDGVYVTSQHYWNEPAQRHLEERSVPVKFVQPHELTGRRIHQTVLVDKSTRLDAVADTIAQQCDDCNTYRLYDGELLVVTSTGSDKAQGLAAVATHFGIKPERIATFGDGSNDVSMLKWSGFSVAMHHGNPDAKAAAKLVAPPTAPEVNLAAAVDMLLGSA